MSYLDFKTIFHDYYKELFSRSSASFLVEHEERISRLLDDDSFSDTLFIDEAFVLYDLIRDECVRRVSLVSSLDD